jgi:NADPH2:quinone reductase
MNQAIEFQNTGGPEVLRLARQPAKEPGAGAVCIRQSCAGVNFIDVYHRLGRYPVAAFPFVPGVEAAGVVDAVGEGVTGFVPGQRVAWAGAPLGGYRQSTVVPAERVLALPSHVTEQTAAAVLLRGLTVHMLLHRVRQVAPGETILVHAAAGGLGLLLTQWATRLGATVIAVVGDDAKAALAQQAGAAHVIVRRREDFVAAVRRITGEGVDVVYDGIGGATLLRSLDCVRPFGVVVSLGEASGSLPDITLNDLGPGRSISIARPSVVAYARDIPSYRAGAAALFDLLGRGLQVTIGTTFPLADAARAHLALESGATSGSILLDLG